MILESWFCAAENFLKIAFSLISVIFFCLISVKAKYLPENKFVQIKWFWIFVECFSSANNSNEWRVGYVYAAIMSKEKVVYVQSICRGRSEHATIYDMILFLFLWIIASYHSSSIYFSCSQFTCLPGLLDNGKLMGERVRGMRKIYRNNDCDCHCSHGLYLQLSVVSKNPLCFSTSVLYCK